MLYLQMKIRQNVPELGQKGTNFFYTTKCSLFCISLLQKELTLALLHALYFSRVVFFLTLWGLSSQQYFYQEEKEEWWEEIAKRHINFWQSS